MGLRAGTQHQSSRHRFSGGVLPRTYCFYNDDRYYNISSQPPVHNTRDDNFFSFVHLFSTIIACCIRGTQFI